MGKEKGKGKGKGKGFSFALCLYVCGKEKMVKPHLRRFLLGDGSQYF